MTETRHFTAPDGARLAFRDEGEGLPLLCLAGLTRSMADFDYLVPHLPPVRLIRMDYRGRGASDWTVPPPIPCSKRARMRLPSLTIWGWKRRRSLAPRAGG